MTPFFIALLALVASTFRTRAAQQAEIVALRHQIAVLQQSASRRLHIRTVPDWVKWMLDVWTTAAGLSGGRMFRCVYRAGKHWAVVLPRG